MGEVIFYRGLVFLFLMVLLVVLYKVINPWVRALCIKLSLEGDEVLKGAGKEDPGNDNETPVAFKGEQGEDGVHEITVVAEEVKRRRRIGRRSGMV